MISFQDIREATAPAFIQAVNNALAVLARHGATEAEIEAEAELLYRNWLAMCRRAAE